MAVPKYKSSKSKSRHRVAQWDGVEEPSLSKCSNCGSQKRPHRVCMECGFYRGNQILSITGDE